MSAILSPSSPAKPNVLVTLGWYDPRFFEAIGRYAREAGWHLAMRSMMEAADPTGWRGDGMLVNDAEVPRLKKFIRRQVKKQPTVLFGANHEGIGCPSVEEDNFAGGRLAAQHFLQRGHQSFCWVGISRGRVERDRRAGFVETLTATGHRCLEITRPSAGGQQSDSWAKRSQWLRSALNQLPKPIALFALDDLLAAEIIEVSLDSGLRVPEDIAVIGAGNIELACDCSPVPISSVDLNFGEVAYRAAQLLNEVMLGNSPPKQPIVIPARGVVMRQSSDSIPVVDNRTAKALTFIKSQFSEPIGVADIAHAADISPRMLHYLFADQLHCSPAEYLRQTRLEQVKQMLLTTDKSIAEIASACGFSTTRNLYRCFVKANAIPPHRWRTHPCRRRLVSSKEMNFASPD